MSSSLKIVKRIRFHAGHQLDSHDGKCSNMHGHQYMVEVGVDGVIQSKGAKSGMIIDFYDFDKMLMDQIYDPMDHSFLTSGSEKISTWLKKNDNKLYYIGAPTTVENISRHIFDKLTAHVNSLPTDKYMYKICLVRVFETPDTYAEVTRDAEEQGCGGCCG